jgi:hypothetical protein
LPTMPTVRQATSSAVAQQMDAREVEVGVTADDAQDLANVNPTRASTVRPERGRRGLRRSLGAVELFFVREAVPTPQARDAGLDAHHDDGPKAGMESVHFRHVIRPRGTRTRVTHVAPAATPHAHSERGEAKEPRRRHRGLRPSGGKAEAVERQPEASTLGRPRDAELTCCASSCS